MNKYIKTAVCMSFGTVKMAWTKLFHPGAFQGSLICYASLRSEIMLDHGGQLTIGKMLKIREGSKIVVRKNGKCTIGNDCFINSNSLIVCHDSIIIGNHCQISPNVQIYDHDHDFRDKEGIKSKHFRCAPVVIGDNVWIGADSVILRGTRIGNNCTIGAGSIIKSDIPDHSLVIQKRDTTVLEIVPQQKNVSDANAES